MPREVHAPLEYPSSDVECSGLALTVVDARPTGHDPAIRQLSFPASFEAAAQSRLRTLVAGRGPELEVVVSVVTADEIPLVDSRGEMTRILVKLSQEVRVAGGPVLSRSEGQSSSDIPRAEATPEEVHYVLGATALNAFDRKWAEERSVLSLNRELAAYAAKRSRENTATP